MGIVYTPSQLEKGFRALFIEQLRMESADYIQKFCTVVDSNAKDEDYAWIGDVGPIDEAEDEVPFYGLSDTSYNLENKKYWGGLAVKRDHLADDQVGGLSVRIRDLAQRARRKPNGLIANALIDGTTNTDFTGEAFFNAAHKARGEARPRPLTPPRRTRHSPSPTGQRLRLRDRQGQSPPRHAPRGRR